MPIQIIQRCATFLILVRLTLLPVIKVIVKVRLINKRFIMFNLHIIKIYIDIDSIFRTSNGNWDWDVKFYSI